MNVWMRLGIRLEVGLMASRSWPTQHRRIDRHATLTSSIYYTDSAGDFRNNTSRLRIDAILEACIGALGYVLFSNKEEYTLRLLFRWRCC